MKFSVATAVLVALAADSVVASTSLSKAAYNKWHETELERWLSDHNVPYPKAADRKELSDLVQKNWDDNVARPYNTWDTNQLSSYLSSRGQQIKKGTEKNKNSLIEQVQAAWYSTGDQASDAYGTVQNYIFDTWTESQLKAFLDYNNVPNPSPRTRDSLLSTARSNYQKVADKVGETAAYPGDWLYTSWSESDLKSWLDERGVPVPQTSTRDKLIASVRRNAYIASQRSSDTLASVSKSAAAAQQSLSDQMISSWDDTKLKQWLDSNGIKVPQGSKRNELMALARKYQASASASGASAFGAATSSAGNQYAQATAGLYDQAKYWYDWALAQVAPAASSASASGYSSASSLSGAAASSASSVSSVASASASSLSKSAAPSVSSLANEAAKSASSLSDRGVNSAYSLADKAASSASSASSSASSLSGPAAKSASSSASSLSSSASSLSSLASKSASSVSKKLSSSSSSASSSASSRAKNEL